MKPTFEKPLVVAAHPDDELLKALALAAAPGAHILTATDGEASTVDHIGNGFVAAGYRRDESRKALTENLGMTADRMHYAGLPDGKLDFHHARLAGRIASITLQHGIDSLISFDEDGFDGHADHVATYAAARLIASVLKIPHFVRVRNAGPNTFSLQGTQDLKVQILQAHASQFNADDPDLISAMNIYAGGFTEEHYRSAA